MQSQLFPCLASYSLSASAKEYSQYWHTFGGMISTQRKRFVGSLGMILPSQKAWEVLSLGISSTSIRLYWGNWRGNSSQNLTACSPGYCWKILPPKLVPQNYLQRLCISWLERNQWRDKYHSPTPWQSHWERELHQAMAWSLALSVDLCGCSWTCYSWW